MHSCVEVVHTREALRWNTWQHQFLYSIVCGVFWNILKTKGNLQLYSKRITFLMTFHPLTACMNVLLPSQYTVFFFNYLWRSTDFSNTIDKFFDLNFLFCYPAIERYAYRLSLRVALVAFRLFRNSATLRFDSTRHTTRR